MLYLPSSTARNRYGTKQSLTRALSAASLVDSSTPHAYSAPLKVFTQPLLAQQLIARFAAANKSSFKMLQTQQERTFGDRTVVKGATFEELTRTVDEKKIGRAHV